MKCPVCNSTRFKGDHKKKKCYRCGYIWKNPRYHKLVFTKDLHIGYGKPQNTMITHDENNRDYSEIDLHDNKFKFKIIKDNPDISIGDQVKNWPSRKEITQRKDFTIIRTTKHIHISTKKRFLVKILKNIEIREKDTAIIKIFVDQASKIQEEFNIILDPKPLPVMREVKPKEMFKSPIQFHGQNVKCVYPNGDIEFIGANAVDKFITFTDNMAIETHADSIIKQLDGGFDTLAYLLSKQTEILEKIINKPTFWRMIISTIRVVTSRISGFFKKSK